MAANENTLTRPIFDLEICSLNKIGVEFDQDCNVNQLSGHYFIHNAGTFRPLSIGRL